MTDASIEFVTFLLAILGYVGLTATMVLSRSGPVPHSLWRVTVFVVVTHVLLVWAVRYQWQVAVATRNGYIGFVLFHAALTAMLASVALRDEWARRLILMAFLVVTTGAMGAVFRYDVVANYRVPVFLLAAAGAVGFMRARTSAQRIKVAPKSRT